MSYRSYIGADLYSGYTNEDFGYAQTYMMYDIAALQYMYGADFTQFWQHDLQVEPWQRHHAD